MNIPFIITIKDSVVDTAQASTKGTCEKEFLVKFESLFPGIYRATNQEELYCILEDGYYTMNNVSICLTWIDVPGIFQEPLDK